MKTINFILIVVLWICERSSSQIPFEDTCSSCQITTLGKTKEIITYDSEEVACKCTWALPTDILASDSYSIAIELKNASLIMDGTTDLCLGFIIFPDIESTCTASHLCRIYHTSTTKCKKSDVIKKAEENGLHCDSYLTYNKEKAQEIGYLANITPGTRKYHIHYLPIDCDSLSDDTSVIQTTSKTTLTEDVTTIAKTANTTSTSVEIKTQHSQIFKYTTLYSEKSTTATDTTTPLSVEKTTKNIQTSKPHTTQQATTAIVTTSSPSKATTARSQKTPTATTNPNYMEEATTNSVIPTNVKTTKISDLATESTTKTSKSAADFIEKLTTTEVPKQTEASNISSTTNFQGPGQMDYTASIAIPLTILLVLLLITIILVLLWRREKKNAPPQSNEEQKFMEVNPDQEMAQTGI